MVFTRVYAECFLDWFEVNSVLMEAMANQHNNNVIRDDPAIKAMDYLAIWT